MLKDDLVLFIGQSRVVLAYLSTLNHHHHLHDGQTLRQRKILLIWPATSPKSFAPPSSSSYSRTSCVEEPSPFAHPYPWLSWTLVPESARLDRCSASGKSSLAHVDEQPVVESDIAGQERSELAVQQPEVDLAEQAVVESELAEQRPEVDLAEQAVAESELTSQQREPDLAEQPFADSEMAEQEPELVLAEQPVVES